MVSGYESCPCWDSSEYDALLFTESGAFEPRSVRSLMRDAFLLTESGGLEPRSARCLMRDTLLLTESGS